MIEAPITLDCTGRDAFTCTREKWRTKTLSSKGLPMDLLQGQNAIQEPTKVPPPLPIFLKRLVLVHPAQDDVVSVGIVAEKEYLYRDTHDHAEIFANEIKKNAWIEELPKVIRPILGWGTLIIGVAHRRPRPCRRRLRFLGPSFPPVFT